MNADCRDRGENGYAITQIKATVDLNLTPIPGGVHPYLHRKAGGAGQGGLHPGGDR